MKDSNGIKHSAVDVAAQYFRAGADKVYICVRVLPLLLIYSYQHHIKSIFLMDLIKIIIVPSVGINRQ